MRRAEGWSLMELILVILILGIIAAFVGPMLLNAMRAYDATQASSGTAAKMRYAMERMAREVRDMRRNASDSAFLDVSAMTAATLTFFKTDGKQVTIAGGGATLTLRYVDSTNVVATLTDQVAAFNLAYYEPSGVSVAAAANSLAFVELSLTLTEGSSNYVNRLRVDVKGAQ